MDCGTPGFPVLHYTQSLLKLMSIELVMLSYHLIFWHCFLLLPSVSLSIRVFSNESVLHIRWPKYWSFSFNISPSNEYSGLISFRIDQFDILVVQGTLKSLLQHTIQKHQFFSAQPFSILTSTLDYRKNHTFDCITEQAHFLTVFACGSTWNIIAIQFLFANWKTPWPLGKMGWRCLNEAIVSQKERWGFLYTCTILCVECPTLCKKIEISHLFKKMKWNFSG